MTGEGMVYILMNKWGQLRGGWGMAGDDSEQEKQSKKKMQTGAWRKHRPPHSPLAHITHTSEFMLQYINAKNDKWMTK